MNFSGETWEQVSRIVKDYPNDTELGGYIRRMSIIHDNEVQRNKDIHLLKKEI
tara:strand:- start:2403 stop:2561 length:159 start_codon:yes stop_codon:yes gene_type:complete